METDKTEEKKPLSFIEQIVENDLKSGEVKEIVTRFPPEPNGYLHIGHLKAINISFSIAKKYNGICHLRMDDTNPEKEDGEYISSIEQDIKWLGFDWGDKVYFASDYYEQMYDIAVNLIKEGLAYVDDLSPEEIKKYRGTLTEKGKESPSRSRSISENLRLFEEMKNGLHPEGKYILRAKIDMSSPNINMRDPAIYRIRYAEHPRTGKKWCIYPMYDFAHPIEDAIEGITHSICTLEFEDHRPLYNWFCEHDDIECYPKQREFSRLNITYTVMSKRHLRELVEKGYVDGWDDPRMPTISAARRRGFTTASLIDFASRVGTTKVEGIVDYSLLEFCAREDLNKKALRYMAVLDPVKVVIDNYPEGKEETFTTANNPENESDGEREIPFSREIYIEKSDFMEVPVKGYHRLYIGGEVRLKRAYYITATSVEKDDQGNITLIHATYDPLSKGGDTKDGRKVKGTIHWVDASKAADAKVRLYDKLFTEEVPGAKTGNYLDDLNKDSLKELNAKVEKDMLNIAPGVPLQFMRMGYFTRDSKSEEIVFNRTVTLKDTWAKTQKQ